MSSVKIILRSKPNKDGTHSLALRIIKNRIPALCHLGHSVKPSDWDAKQQRVKKVHPNSVRLNNFLVTRLAEASNKVLEAETNSPHLTSAALAALIDDKEPVSAIVKTDNVEPILPSRQSTPEVVSLETVNENAPLFFPQAQNYLDALRAAGKYNEYTAEKPRIGHFREFANNENLTFIEITPGMLSRFHTFLKSYHVGKFSKTKKVPKKAIKERTIVNHLSMVRSIFAYARRDKLISEELSPFKGKDGTKINYPGTSKIGISADDIVSLEQLWLREKQHEHARKLWLFAFYFAGMRVSDVFRLKWSDFQNNRLHYVMGKNDKEGSLKVPDKAVVILDYYRQYQENENDLVFPELKGVDLSDEFNTERTIAFKTSAIDKFLRQYVAPAAGIKAKLTMHIARHTFADLAGDTIPVQMLQKLYRHSDIRTTIAYQSNFNHKEPDDALDAVIGKIKCGPKI